MARENAEFRGVAMLLPSVPPRPAGGAELQALALSRALAARGEHVFIVSEWVPGLPDKAELGGIAVFRPHGFLNVLWRAAAAPLKFFKRKTPHADSVRTDYSALPEDGKKGITVRRFGWLSVPYALVFAANAFIFLRRRRHEFDVIHAHHAEWDGFAAVVLARLLGKKALVKDSTVNGFRRLQNDAFGWRMKNCMKERAYFAALTGAIAGNLETEGVPPARIFRIPNGVPLPPMAVPGNKPDSCLFVGNLTQQPAKGFDVLLRAWPLVVKNHPGAVLHVAGGGPAAAYGAYAEKLGIVSSVRFYGSVSNISALYSSAAVFVLPSRREGMSNALLEAMAHGLPAVASAIPGMNEVVLEGETGLLVPPDDERSLALALSRLLGDAELSRTMGAAARKRAEEYFSLEKIAAVYSEVYRDITSRACC